MTSDRPSDRVEPPDRNGPGEGRAGADFANGRVASTARRPHSPYLTADRLAAISESLGPSDWQLIDLFSRFGVASGPQAALAIFGDGETSGRAARRALRRLTEAELLDRLDRRIGGTRAGSDGVVYRLGPTGRRLLGDRRRNLEEPGLHHLLHTLAVTELYVRLKVAERAGTAGVLSFDPEPECWRPYTGRHGEAVVLKPDAFCDVRLGGSRRLWFVEVDRGTVSTGTLRSKLARYAEYLETGSEQAAQGGVFPRVAWVCSIERRSEHLRQLAARENQRLGAELHRLLPDEWQPPQSRRARPQPLPTTSNTTRR